MAEKINTMRKVVVSTTLSSSDWESTTVVNSDFVGAVRALINLQVFPLMLGSGIHTYPERDEPTRLELVSARPIENGVVLQTYRVRW